jgi:hypothetical protein
MWNAISTGMGSRGEMRNISSIGAIRLLAIVFIDVVVIAIGPG